MTKLVPAVCTALLGWCASPGASPGTLGEIEPLPLQGRTRELSFTTEEGTWVSVDVTPDDKSVVFDLLGDLYAVPLTGGPAIALTHGLPYDSQPRVSPDGQWIAFISDRDGADNLWVMRRADGALRRLSSNHQHISISPSWTPDSRQVLVAEVLSYLSEAQMRLYDLSGQMEEVLDKDANPVRGSGGVVSSDGHYLYFAQRDPADESLYGMPIAQIRRLDLHRRTVETLTNGLGGGTRPAISADGRQLVYATREEGKTTLRLRDLRSGEDRLLIGPVQQDRQDYGRALRGDHLPGYALSPDGQSVLLSYGGKINRVGLKDGEAEPIPFRVKVALDVGPPLHKPYRLEQGPLTARIIHHPSFSPDGSQIAMSILTKLYVMPARSGALPKRLTRGEALEFQPSWSADGRWLAYVVWSSKQGGHIWKIRSDGHGTPQRLTAQPAFYTDLAFSPDGKRIVAMRGNESMRPNSYESARSTGPLDLVWISADGGEAHVVQPDCESRYPHVTDDPERIYTTDGHTLTSVRYDGSDSRTHLRLSGRFDSSQNSQPVAERIFMHPQGRQALALINKQVWRIALPQSDSTPSIDMHSESATATRLTDVGADFFGWTPGGKSIAWSIGSTVYRVATARADGKGRGSDGLRDSAPEIESFPVRLRVSRAMPAGTIVLKGAKVIPMSTQQGAQRPELGDIVITGNRIVSIAAAGSQRIPAGARIVDISGRYVVPGFIDAHAHWRYPTREIQDPDNWSLRINLAYGVTAGLDVQANHGENLAYQDMVETGQTTGTRAFMVGPGVFGVNNYKPFESNFQSYAETLAYLKRYQQHYRTHNIKSYLIGDRRQRQWMVLAAQALDLMPTTEGYGDPLLDITHAIDGMHGSEHALIDSAVYSDLVQVFVRTQTSYTPTLNVTHYGIAGSEYFFSRTEVQDDPKINRFYPRPRLLELTGRRHVWGRDSEFSFRAMAAQAAAIQRAGGLVGVGSHGELQGLGYHWELQMLAMGGMTPAEILRAATLDGARILGVEQDLGSLESGKLADLVVLKGNPLDDIKQASEIAYVMKNGVLYDGDTLAVVSGTAR